MYMLARADQISGPDWLTFVSELLKKLYPIGSAVLSFFGDKQTDKQVNYRYI